MELIIITPDKFFFHEAQLIEELFELGMRKLHLRKPNATIDEVENLLQHISVAYHSKIVLHQHPQLLNKYALGGFHITHYYTDKIKEVRKFLKPHHTFSISTHQFDEIKNQPDFDYYFISPIFDSISKQGLHAAFEKHELEEGIKMNKGKKIFALGGVNEKNIGVLQKIGFSGVAVLGSIWTNDNPLVAFQNILESTKKEAAH